VSGSGFFFGQTVLRTWNEHEEINETSFSFELADRSRKIFGLPPEPMKKWVASYGLAQNDSSLSIVHGLLEVEGALVQSLPTEKDCSRVDRMPLLRRSEPRNPLEIF